MDLSPKRTDRVEATAYFTFFLRWYCIVAKELSSKRQAGNALPDSPEKCRDIQYEDGIASM